MNMKKNCGFLLLLMCVLLGGCNIDFVVPESSLGGTDSASLGDPSVIASAQVEPSSSFGNPSSPIIEPSSSTLDSSSSSSLNSSFNEELYQKMTLDYQSLSAGENSLTKYNTGNYGSLNYNEIRFEFYRAYHSDNANGIATFLTSTSTFIDYSLPGAFYNIDPIYDIHRIKINYYMDNTKSLDAVLRYGSDKLTNKSVSIPYSNILTSFVYDVDMTNYFKIETNGQDLTIDSVVLYYSNQNQGWKDTEYLSSGEGDYRLNPSRFEGTLVSGQSSVDIPVSINVTNKNYEVTEWKTYTYYSYDDVVNNPSLAEYASYTTPEDVANYFVAFGEYPANYVVKSMYNDAKSYFGSNTRCVSSYSRTDGYATAVPYATNGGQLLYYECDIALSDDYSSSNRGVGRVVVWMYGFDGTGYDSSPVAVYTDDHYATFREYYNNGTFGKAFNAERSRENYVWGLPTTLN